MTLRKYRPTGHPIFDPVDAGVSIVVRARALNVPQNEPMGVIYDAATGCKCLKDADVTTVMRRACVGAYPDPKHYMRIHIKRILPHSNRVTAAVCLKQGGCSNDEIAFRLRWHPTSVPTYLRECYQAVGQILQNTLMGALSLG